MVYAYYVYVFVLSNVYFLPIGWDISGISVLFLWIDLMRRVSNWTGFKIFGGGLKIILYNLILNWQGRRFLINLDQDQIISQVWTCRREGQSTIDWVQPLPLAMSQSVSLIIIYRLQSLYKSVSSLAKHFRCLIFTMALDWKARHGHLATRLGQQFHFFCFFV